MKLWIALFALTAALFAADLTGTWDMNVDIAGNTGSPTFVLKQSGSGLSGTYSGALGEAEVKGKVEGNDVELRFTVAPQGDKVEVIYAGTLKADGTLEGKLVISGFGDGTFKGVKRK